MQLRFGLTLKDELTVGDIVVVTTVASVSVATIFNIGYFARTNAHYIALLTPQDMLVGVALAFLPTLILANLVYVYEKIFRMEENVTKIAWILLIAFVFGVMILFSSYFFTRASSYISELIFVTVIFGNIFSVFARYKGLFRIILLIGTIHAFVYGVGEMYYDWQILLYSNANNTIHTTSGNVISPIFRITQNYTFVYQSDSLTALSNREIESIGK